MMGLTIGLMKTLGYVSLGMSLLGLFIVGSHWRFFSKADKSKLGKAMALVFFSNILMYGSIAAYNFNWVFMDGAYMYRVALKILQVFSISFNIYALIRLMACYKRTE